MDFYQLIQYGITFWLICQYVSLLLARKVDFFSFYQYN